jgi:hypothetical protein
MKEDYVKKYPQIADKSYVLYWGYNEEDFIGVDTNLVTEERDYKTIVHAGNIFDYQNPVMLWREIKRRIDLKEKFRIKFFGTVAPLVKSSIRDNGLDEITEYCGFLPYREMLKELFKADYLLVTVTEKRHVPGKLFEYLRVAKPIIAFGDDNQEVKNILESTGSGMIYNYREDIRSFFDNEFNPNSNKDLIKKFNREKIAERLSTLLC